MTKDEFITEVMGSTLKPPNFMEMYDLFLQYQTLAFDTLNEVHRLLSTYGIKYYLAFGSLLGAIRDNGPIPWDYDVDIFVPYDMKDDLINVLQNHLSKNYYFDCAEVNPKCINPLIRVSPVGYHSDVLHVDIYFLIGTPKTYKERRVFFSRLIQIQRMRFAKNADPFVYARGNKKWLFLYVLRKIRYCAKNYNSLIQEYNNLCSQYPCSTSAFLTTSGIGSGFRIYPTCCLSDGLLYKTIVGSFYVPADYNTILKIIFGDYTQIPSLQSRINEISLFYKKHLYFKQ